MNSKTSFPSFRDSRVLGSFFEGDLTIASNSLLYGCMAFPFSSLFCIQIGISKAQSHTWLCLRHLKYSSVLAESCKHSTDTLCQINHPVSNCQVGLRINLVQSYSHYSSS
jgi:hypothetical protein